MPGTAGTVISGKIGIYTGSTPAIIGCLTNVSLKVTNDMRDITCKDSYQWFDALPGQKSWEMSADGNFAYDATNGATGLYTTMLADTAIPVVFQTSVTGDKKWSGNAYLSSWEIDAQGTNANATYKLTFKGVGTLTMATI